jgi:hypothetical protein
VVDEYKDDCADTGNALGNNDKDCKCISNDGDGHRISSDDDGIVDDDDDDGITWDCNKLVSA